MNNLRIADAIKDIEKLFKELKEMKIEKKEDLNDIRNFHASSMICLAIINRTIDIGTEIIVKKEISMPTRYKDMFEPLIKEGIISKELEEEMKKLMEHRNFLAHEYFGLDEKRLMKVLKDVYAVKAFIERVKTSIKKQGKIDEK